MSRKRLIILAVVVVVAFVAWQLTGSKATTAGSKGGIVSFLGLPTITPIPGATPQPQNGAQALQQSGSSNLATLFPPDVFGADSLGTID